MIAVDGVEITQRYKNGREFTLILNHNNNIESINLKEGSFINLLKGETVKGVIYIL